MNDELTRCGSKRLWTISRYYPDIKIYITIILPVVLYGCETWSFTLTEEHRLRVFENRVLRRIFGPKRDEVTGDWRKLHIEGLHSLYSSPNSIRQIKKGKRGGRDMWHACERRRNCTGFWRESQKERDYLKDQGVDGRMGSECTLGRLIGECRVDPVGSR
jgi:hypothetical protein